MTLTFAIVLITNIVNLGLLLFVLKRKDQGSSILHLILFVGSIIFLVMWSVCNYLADTSIAASEALFWTRATFPPSLLMCWFVLFFSYVFPVVQKKILIVLFYFVLTLLFSVVTMGDSMIQSVTLDPSIGVSNVVVGDQYIFMVLLYLALIFHATYNLMRNYWRLSGTPKLQTRSVLIGWGTFLVFAVMTNAVLPLITGHANWSKFGPLGSVVMVAFISYAIVRHGFLNIKVIIQRGLVYTILLSGIVGVYVSLLFITQYIFQGTNTASIVVSAFITTVIGIFGVPPLTVYFQNVTAPFFFKDAYDYAAVLRALADVLNKNIAQDSIVKKSSAILQNSLKASTVTFMLSADTPVVTVEHSLVVPIRSNKKRIGILTLGEKRSGDLYTGEDLRLLETFCSQAAVALEKAALYKQVKEYAQTLEKKVAERTSEIVSIQKEQESMMLEISHGLQTPLTIMKGELFFLRKQGYETEKIDTIDSSIDRISAFIYKLLSMYRLETTPVTEFVQVSLGDLLHTVSSSFKEKAKHMKSVIRVVIERDITVEADYEEIEEVFSNLVSNAIKYTSPERENEIGITLSGDETHARVTVEDTGIGIREEYIPRLFKKFYRVKDATTKGIQGTGLGLVVCKKIIERHNGTIDVSSAFGKGTTITVVLPRVAQRDFEVDEAR